ncbi:MAG: HNH endonuclease, partial [Candidatus Pacebacteria bacterium]|nr:HNH endonuclease [Candidatus Paceibacterota bacterium]
ETILQRPDHHRPSIEHLFKVKTDRAFAKKIGKLPLYNSLKNKGYGKILSVCEDGRIRPNKIIDIFQNGEKEVWKLQTEDSFVEATLDHRFLTDCGWKTIEEIYVGDMVATKGEYEKTNFTGLYNFYDVAMPSNSKIGKRGFQKRPNGESVLYKKHRREYIKNFGNFCEKCKKEVKRIETHHINGDRKKNLNENLIMLCPSCHKKEDYKLGRKGQYSKGIPIKYEKVLSKNFSGTKMTYDIEMEAPNHNFIANGFVSHNSHSAAYSTISFWCGWLKHYYPNEFFAAALSNTEEKEQEYIREARRRGIKIFPPNINISGFKFISKDNKIIGSLKGVKGLGDKGIQAIIEKRPYKNFQDFLDRLPKGKVNRKAIEALIKIGVFGEDGARPLYDDFIVGKSSYQKTLFDFTEEKIDIKEWTKKEIESFRNELYILPPETHPIEEYQELIDKMEISSDYSLVSEIDFEEQKGETIWLRGLVSQIKYRNWGSILEERPRPGDDMYNYYSKHPWNSSHCLFDIEDETGNTLCSVFPDIYEKYEKIMEKGNGTPILIKGKVGFNIDRIYIQEIYDFKELSSEKITESQKALFESPLRKYEHVKKTSICDLEEKGTIIGIFGIPKTHIDKNGNEMAFVPFEDLTGSITIVCFASEWEYKKERIKEGHIAGINVQKLAGDGKSYQAKKIILIQ